MAQFFDFSGFYDYQYAWLILGFVFFLCSIIFHLRDHKKWGLFFLTCTAFCFFIFAALLDPILNLWDERFHAVVAQNCMKDFTQPKLFKELLLDPHNYFNWTNDYIWLHKQPLFLWVIALSFKIFGVSEFALRLPSALMATALIPLVYRIASLLVTKKMGYYAAISAAFSWFLISLVSGGECNDHNDVCFLFTVTTSIWAWMEYIRSNKKVVWAIAAGVFSGAAVLTKWMPGLLVYFIWGLYLLSYHGFKIKEWKISHLLAALLTTVVIFLPWQLFILNHYPEVAIREYDLNALHFFESVEGHGENLWFHFKMLSYLYIGSSDPIPPFQSVNYIHIINFIILGAGLITLCYQIHDKRKNIILISTLSAIMIFYSIATTKMIAYTFMIAPIWFMALGSLLYGIDNILSKIGHRMRVVFLIPIILFFSFYQMNFSKIRLQHTDKECYWRRVLIEDKRTYQKISKELPANCLIFNCYGRDANQFLQQNIEAMFYTKRDCYAQVPTEKELRELQSKQIPIAVFTHHPIPDYMMQDSSIIKIDKVIMSNL